MDKNDRAYRAINVIARLSVDKASQALSLIFKENTLIEMESLYAINVKQAYEALGKEKGKVIGASVVLHGDAQFKFLFYVKENDSLTLNDLFLQRPVGTTKEFDAHTLSAVQEAGNILASSISNVFASNFQIKLLPEPPTITHDFEKKVFQEYLRDITKNEDAIIMIIESRFSILKSNIICFMFLLPYPGSEEVLFKMSECM